MEGKGGWKTFFHPRNRDTVLAAAAVGAALLLWAVLCMGEDKGEPVSAAAPGSEREQQLAGILERIEGAGRVEVMIAGESTGYGAETVSGAVVVAEGASDPLVRLRILQAARTALDLPSSGVEIFPMRGEAP